MKTISITIPTIPNPLAKLSQIFSTQIKPAVTSSVVSFTDFVQQNATDSFTSSRSTASEFKRKFQFNKFNKINKKFLVIIPVIIGGIILAIVGGSSLRNNTGVLGSQAKDSVSLEKPISEKELNKTFSFPILDNSDKEVGKIQYTIEKAALRKEFVINGQKATALEGRAFLILSVKMKNDTENTVSINTRDFVRMKVKGSDELFAPTIHNDPVEVQAISTLPTQLGFPITDDIKEFILQIGEISGKKQTIDLKF